MFRIARLFAAAAVAAVLSAVVTPSTDGIGWDSATASAAPVTSLVSTNGIGWD